MRLFLAALSVSLVIGAAAPAHSDPDGGGGYEGDGPLLASLDAAGITYSNPDQAIVTARTVCRLVANGQSGSEVLRILQARNPGLSTEHAGQFMAIAVRSYCPDQFVPTVPQTPAESSAPQVPDNAE